jgi:hypothetical protein
MRFGAKGQTLTLADFELKAHRTHADNRRLPALPNILHPSI